MGRAVCGRTPPGRRAARRRPGRWQCAGTAVEHGAVGLVYRQPGPAWTARLLGRRERHHGSLQPIVATPKPWWSNPQRLPNGDTAADTTSRVQWPSPPWTSRFRRMYSSLPAPAGGSTGFLSLHCSRPSGGPSDQMADRNLGFTGRRDRGTRSQRRCPHSPEAPIHVGPSTRARAAETASRECCGQEQWRSPLLHSHPSNRSDGSSRGPGLALPRRAPRCRRAAGPLLG